jgi:UDP:flavonoid glycosyltransferase YjiC (YdhE family)
MVLLPIGADQPFNAARCDDLHVGRVLNPVITTPEDVRLAALAVLTDATYKQSVMKLKAEIAALPDPQYGVQLLEQLRA